MKYIFDDKIEFAKIVDLKHEKGNFRFYCFDFGSENVITIEEINSIEKVINNNNQDVHIDLIVYNKIDYTYEDRIPKTILLNQIEK